MRTAGTTVDRAISGSGLTREDALPLLAHATGRERSWLLAHGADRLADAAAEAFAALAERRRRGEPVAYLVGRRAFWTFELEVSPSVLIPRPETELLVEQALAAIPPQDSDAGRPPLRVLDLGTGSGAVALAIASERPQVRVFATDASDRALAIAAGNAGRLGIGNVVLVRATWLEPFAEASFDVVVGNPPYVADGDPHLFLGDLAFEPREALSAGPDGLGALRTIIAEAPRCLRPGGRLLLEHGFAHGGAVRALFAAAGFGAIETARDLGGHERVTAGAVAPR